MKKFGMILMAMATVVWSCNDKDGDEAPGTAPALPPSSSMAPDFSGFSDSDAPDGGRVATIHNWVYAAGSVGIYSSILSGVLAVPVTAFKLATDQPASYDADLKMWVWQYDISVPQKGSFSVKLTADVKSSSVDWTGYISRTGYFSDFVWFTGESDVNAESGSWTLFESPDKPEAWLSAEWSKSEVDGIANVTFTVEKEGDNFDSSIAYEVDASADLNRHVTIVDTSSENTIDISWNAEEKYGRVKSELFFEDTLFHCWDSTFNDVDCE